MHPLVEFGSLIDQANDEHCNLDILKWLLPQINQSKSLLLKSGWFSNNTKWMWKILNVLYNDKENMNECFLVLVFWFLCL